jgi:hypothetical protein
MPAQGSATQLPLTQDWVGLQVFPAQGSATQKPSASQRWLAPQPMKAQAWTQSPCRQNEPPGQMTPLQGSATQAPPRQRPPPAQPAS